MEWPRRTFLEKTGKAACLALGVACAAKAWRPFGAHTHIPSILPPGAGDEKRFFASCTGCQLCVAQCPQRILAPLPRGFGQVALDLRRGACDYACNRCSRVCPTGAIRPLTLRAKQRTRIALAEFDQSRCKVFQAGEKCGDCVKACPTLALTPRRTSAPVLNESLCIGCGACQKACPVAEKAITVHAVKEQERIKET